MEKTQAIRETILKQNMNGVHMQMFVCEHVITATAMGHEYSLDGSKPRSTLSAVLCNRVVVSL